MAVRERRYLSFLLRLWQVRQNGNETWRASLEDSHTGERHGFAGLESLNTFLRQLTQSKGEEEPNNKISDEEQERQ